VEPDDARGSELAYYNSAELIAKYYSLGVTTDYQTAARSAVEHDKAFMNMLASAERNARASARGARIATGSIPCKRSSPISRRRSRREGDLSTRSTRYRSSGFVRVLADGRDARAH